MKRFWLVLLALLLLFPSALSEVTITITDPDGEEVSIEVFESEPEGVEAPVPEEPAASDARTAFIDGIISLAREKYDEAGGRARRAQYAGDIYVCKNFTVYLFRENADGFRMGRQPRLSVDTLVSAGIDGKSSRRTITQPLRLIMPLELPSR